MAPGDADGRAGAPSISASVSVNRSNVRIEAVVRNLDALPAGQLLEPIGQVVGLRHNRAIEQHRNDRYVALERRLNLDADEIVAIIKAVAIVLARAREPILANKRDQRVASANPFGQHFNEIATGRDVVDVNEDAFTPEAVLQAIVDAPREPRRILSSIANKNAAPHEMPSGLEERNAKAPVYQIIVNVRGRCDRPHKSMARSRLQEARSPLLHP